MKVERFLLLPGMDGSGIFLKPLLKALPGGTTAQIVRYPADRVATYADLIASIKLPGEPFVIIAESYGGPLAIRLAAARPRHLKALVLSATFIRCPWSRIPRWMETFVRPGMFALNPPDALMEWVLAGIPGGKLPDGFREMMRAIRPEVLAARLREIIALDVTKEFQRIECPMLYLNGRRDRLVPMKVMNDMRVLRPDLRCVRLDAPHLIFQTRPADAAKAIAEFLNDAGH